MIKKSYKKIAGIAFSFAILGSLLAPTQKASAINLPLKEIQSETTNGNTRTTEFKINNESFLAVYSPSTAGDLRFLKWNDLSKKYDQVQAITGGNVQNFMDISSVSINGEVYVVMTSVLSGTIFYKYNSTSGMFEEYSLISDGGDSFGVYLAPIEIVNDDYLIISGGGFSGSLTTLQKYNTSTNKYELHQGFEGLENINVYSSYSFDLNGDKYAVLGGTTRDNAGIDPTDNKIHIYKWSVTENKFVPSHKLDGNKAQDFKKFNIGDNNYLAVANFNGSSSIFKFDSSLGKFTELNTFADVAAFDVESVDFNGNHFVLFADSEKNKISIYKNDTAGEFQYESSIETNGGLNLTLSQLEDTKYVISGEEQRFRVLSLESEFKPLYRFWSDTYRHHFYTANASEKDNLIANDTNWKYEGIAYYIKDYDTSSKTCPSGVSVFRFWSAAYRGHFYTRIEEEKNKLIAEDPNWAYEGVAFCADETQLENQKPVHRFWSLNYKGHFYTMSEGEKDDLIAKNPNWEYEGIAYYANE